jgi:MFS family permease
MQAINKKYEPYYVYAVMLLYFFAINLMVSVSTIYLLTKDLDFFHINLLESLGLLFVFLLEIPTGIIGDKFGHKVSFQIGMIFRAIFYLFLTITNSFFYLCIVFFILSLSEACWSGSFTAWYVGHMQKENHAGEHIRLFSNNIILESIAGIIAGFIGSVIAYNSFTTGYILAGLLVLVSAIMLIPIHDDFTTRKINNMGFYTKNVFPDIKTILKPLFNFLKSNNTGQWGYIIPQAIAFIAISGIDNLWQPLFVEKQDEGLVWVLGYAWVFIRLGTLMAGIITNKLRKYKNTKKYFQLMLILSGILIPLSAMLSTWLLSSLAFALHASIWVSHSILTRGYLYQNIPETSKATTLSIISSLDSITAISGMLSLALIANHSIKFAFYIASLIMIIAFITSQFFKKEKRNK